MLILFSAIVLFNCKKGEVENTILSLSITKHPEGGMNIITATAEIKGYIIGPEKDIPVNIKWFWEDGNLENKQLKSDETVIFYTIAPKTFSSAYHSWDWPLLNYYWIEVSWCDDDGMHYLESAKGFYFWNWQF